MPEQKPQTNNSIEEGKTCAILAYLLLGIIWYFVDEKMKKNDFAKFHVKQAMVLLIVSLVGSLALGMTFVLSWLIPLYQLLIFILLVIGMYNAFNSEKKELPFIGKFGEKFKF